MPGHDMGSMAAEHDTSSSPGHDGHAILDHSMPGMATPGHAMGQMPIAPDGAAAGTSLPAGHAPPPPVPTDHAADRVYGEAAMAMGRYHLRTFHGGQQFFQVLTNIAEVQLERGNVGYGWDSEAWYGGDIDRLVVKTQGEGSWGGRLECGEVQALYSHAVGPYFNLQGGVRTDIRPSPSRVYATVGVEGLAPDFFDVEGALFLSDRGELFARVEGTYDQRITQRLILQPRIELNLAAQDSHAIGIGAGLSDAELGLRLRYEISREFAPYVGVRYSSTTGQTRRFLREAGGDPGGLALVLGVRTWF